ncbi:hypothetical protein CRG98_043274 [Punica granatum]|uniref:Caffeoyl-CoA O-methyltransferase n=1 Tax=Punica granatum TaxID=22663 RepID=A0A2I0HXU9_PUNGR|nr:hypothetical protein CRG98_043274 [Punica granatum]
MNAKETIELGVFTGYSLLVTALSILQDGKIVAIGVDREAYESIGLPITKRANIKNKIEFIESEALPALDLLLQRTRLSRARRNQASLQLRPTQENEGSFDVALVDANRANQENHHERLMRQVRVGGVTVYDKTLWGGNTVLPDASSALLIRRRSWQDIAEFNKTIA